MVVNYCASCWNINEFCDCTGYYDDYLHLMHDLPMDPNHPIELEKCVSIWHIQEPGFRTSPRISTNPNDNLGVANAPFKPQVNRFDYDEGGTKRFGGSTKYWPHVVYTGGITNPGVAFYSVEVVLKRGNGDIDYAIIYFNEPPQDDHVRHAIASGGAHIIFDTIEERNNYIPTDENKWTIGFQGLYGKRTRFDPPPLPPGPDPEDPGDDRSVSTTTSDINTLPVVPPPETPEPVDFVLAPTYCPWCIASLPFYFVFPATAPSQRSLGINIGPNLPTFSGPNDVKPVPQETRSALVIASTNQIGDVGRFGILTFAATEADLVPRTLTFEYRRSSDGVLVSPAVYGMTFNGVNVYNGQFISYTYTPGAVGMTIHPVVVVWTARPNDPLNWYGSWTLRDIPSNRFPWPSEGFNMDSSPTRDIGWVGPPLGPVARDPDFTILTHVSQNVGKTHDVTYNELDSFMKYISYAGHLRQDLPIGSLRLNNTQNIADATGIWGIAFPSVFNKETNEEIDIYDNDINTTNLSTQKTRVKIGNSQGNQGRSISIFKLNATSISNP